MTGFDDWIAAQQPLPGASHGPELLILLRKAWAAGRRAEQVPVPEHPFPVRGGCGQNGDGSWAKDGHGCPVCGAYGQGGTHGGGIEGSPGCPNRAVTYDYDGNVAG
jgi:hypothetical protein